MPLTRFSIIVAAVLAVWRPAIAQAGSDSINPDCAAVYKSAADLGRDVAVFINDIHMAAGLRAHQEAQMTRDKGSAKRLNEIADTSLATINAAKPKFARALKDLADGLDKLCRSPR